MSDRQAIAAADLKGCPFCGGEGLVHRGPFGGSALGCWISCVGTDCHVVPRAKGSDEASASAAWNARVERCGPDGSQSAVMGWRPISSSPIPEYIDVVVGWWFSAPGMGSSWETDTDILNDSATHWTPLPSPPASGAV